MEPRPVSSLAPGSLETRPAYTCQFPETGFRLYVTVFWQTLPGQGVPEATFSMRHPSSQPARLSSFGGRPRYARPARLMPSLYAAFPNVPLSPLARRANRFVPLAAALLLAPLAQADTAPPAPMVLHLDEAVEKS